MHLLLILIVSLILSATSSLAGIQHSLDHKPGARVNHIADHKKKKVAKRPLSKAKISKVHSKGRTKSKHRATSVTIRRVVRSAKKRPIAVVSAKLAKPKKTLVLYENLAIMGSRYAKIPILDGKLTGTVYYLASGHGGPDPGAIGTYGTKRLPEDEYAYDVTIRLARILIQHGATVYMIVQDHNDGIRDSAVLPIDYDEVAYPNLPIPLNQTTRLHQTTTAVNSRFARHKGQYQRFVTIHVDSRSKGQTIDVFFYHHPESKAGLTLARHIHKKFQANYKRYQPSRPYLGRVSSRGSLYVVKNSHPPTVFIELGNIQNQQDQRRFLLAENRQALANWMCQGMLADYQSR